MFPRPFWMKIPNTTIEDAFNKVTRTEIDRIRAGDTWTHSVAAKPQNKLRNRYTDVFPWDKNRVKLPSKHNDYINASHIDLPDSRYIASQGPLRQTIHHFWSMCYNESQRRGEDDIIIVMITPLVENNRKKCEKYWPDESWDLSSLLKEDQIDLPSMNITNDRSTSFSKFTLTELSLTVGDDVKKVWHYYYHDWADTRTPSDGLSLIELSNQVHKLKSTKKVQVPIIHCSAGVGRTGTFIALDYFNIHDELLVDAENSDPIYELFQLLRNDRLLMIQTLEQYEFLYEFFSKVVLKDFPFEKK
ncbi:tyrosine-protein phosphatase 1 [[Candida] jaroonii]|uniref:Tyrosine-protein phosphatase 1 n=1 Tax=[Candida] jaroonii TaxID=467808 RepID=A0ACA9Y881_9ASCO|nr:tyrosine-protein phosphatase 1 [[Candida] jaroonii]